MFVILTRDIKGVGFKNEVKEVKKGYFMNFLFPQGLARMADKVLLSRLEQARATEAASVGETKAKASEFVEVLNGKSVTLSAKADEGTGTLFGSIAEGDITEAINHQFKLSLTAGQVLLDEHLKHTGEYDVKIKLSDEHEATVKVVVEGE
jgi:large subunit ribosomal protein L9